MSADTRAFRNALGCFPTGIVVVIASAGGALSGITVNSFGSVSLDPPLILWSIARSSRRYEVFTKADEFTVSVLGEEQQALAERIAAVRDNPLEGVPLDEAGATLPAIAGALASFECTREATHDGGDHAIIVGRVRRFAHRGEGGALTFFRGTYGKIANGA